MYCNQILPHPSSRCMSLRLAAFMKLDTKSLEVEAARPAVRLGAVLKNMSKQPWCDSILKLQHVERETSARTFFLKDVDLDMYICSHSVDIFWMRDQNECQIRISYRCFYQLRLLKYILKPRYSR